MKTITIILATLFFMTVANGQSPTTVENSNGNLTTSIPATLFKGQWLRVPVNTSEVVPGSQFILSLSDANGNFDKTKENDLYSICFAGASYSGNCIVTIPESVVTSDHYKIRMTIISPLGMCTTLEQNLSIRDMYVWYADIDGDQLGDPAKSFVSTNDREAGFVSNHLDDDDSLNQSEEVNVAK